MPLADYRREKKRKGKEKKKKLKEIDQRGSWRPFIDISQPILFKIAEETWASISRDPTDGSFTGALRSVYNHSLGFFLATYLDFYK